MKTSAAVIMPAALLVALLLSLGSYSFSHAAIVDLLVSEKDRVFVDTNGNTIPDAGDGGFKLKLDEGPGVILVNGAGGVCPGADLGFAYLWQAGGTATQAELRQIMSHGGVTNPRPDWKQLDFILSKSGGATFNKLAINWTYPVQQPVDQPELHDGALVDSDADGICDRVEGTANINTYLVGGHPHRARFRFDLGIAFYPSAADRQYVKIQEGVKRIAKDDCISPTGGINYSPTAFWNPMVFLPLVDDAVQIKKADGTLLGRLSLREACAGTGPLPVAPTSVPSLDEWGLAVLFLLLFAAALWVMRKTGFGRSLPRR